MVLAPRRTLESIGIRPDRRAKVIAFSVGVQEMLAGGTILAMRHRRVGAWSRVLGDMIHLTLLGSAFATRRADTRRLLGAIGFVAVVSGLDSFAAARLAQAEGTFERDGSDSSGIGAPPDDAAGPAHVRTAITVQGSEEDVRRRFAEFGWRELDPAGLGITFQAAPGDRGIEVHVNVDPAAPGGAVGAAMLKAAGRSADQRINDDLRRFKALVETGVEVRSDKSPEGPSALRQMFQRPGNPKSLRSGA
ncbi:MAG: hypothetical protein WAU75_01650 [Solirubrobacteraceae bacterium]